MPRVTLHVFHLEFRDDPVRVGVL